MFAPDLKSRSKRVPFLARHLRGNSGTDGAFTIFNGEVIGERPVWKL